MANFLKSLFVKGVEIDTAGAITGDVLKYDGSKFGAASAGGGSSVGSLDDLSDVVITTPLEFQTLEYNGTNWVNANTPSSVYVRNAEATTITTGTCVYLFGATGDHATVKRADKTSDTTSAKTVGVVSSNILASENGVVVTQGYVDGINLSTGYTSGDVLWLGDDGAFTTTKATAPDHLVFIGVVVRATNNGIIYVSTQNGYELDELHNVSLPSPNSGEFLKYNGSLWVADTIDLGTDTTGNYMSGVSVQNGLTVSHTPGEGSSATIGVDNALLGNFLLEGASGNSYGLIGTSAYLDVKNTNGYNKEIELDIAAVKTQLNTDGYITETSASTLTNKTLTSPVITGAIFNDGSIVFEGATADASETTLSVTDPTADRTITLPDATGTVALLGTIALGTDTTGNYMSGISGTSPVSVSHTPAEGSSATVALASSYGDTQNPYGSKTANQVLAAPNGSAGAPTFRALATTDIPNLDASIITSGTLPNARLSFSGTGVSTDDISIEMGGARTGSGHCYIDMHAASGTDFESRILRLAGANGNFSFTNTGTGTMSFEQGTNAPINFTTSSVSRIYIDTAGEVGINTTSPVYTTDIVGQLRAVSYHEKWSVLGAATGALTLDVKSYSNYLYTSSSTANWTLNVRGDSSTTLDTLLTSGDSVVITFMSTQGATGYYPTSFSVDGSAQTVRWQGGTAPTTGNTSTIDVYVYTIVKTGSGTFYVFGSQTKFDP